MENTALEIQHKGQLLLGGEGKDNPIKVSIGQFYGIEINDFAVTVAKTALWIAESQMMKQTEELMNINLDFLPLKSYANIVEGNALKIDWGEVVPKEKLDYIMGNPPFVGARLMNTAQKNDVLEIFNGVKGNGNLDYVACWYKKASDMMTGTGIRTALVSTNSITQGEQVAILWKYLFEKGVHIDFAYKTFRWDSEANSKAKVHCVIVGFSKSYNKAEKRLYDTEKSSYKVVKNINGYLVETDDIVISSRSKPICNVPEIGIGNKPVDGGFFLFTEEEMEKFVNKEPKSEKYFRKWLGSKEFINGFHRYCLWLGNCSPKELIDMPECLKVVENVRNFRFKSKSEPTRKLADKPTKFHVHNMPQENYIIIPKTSSEKRKYIPMGFMTPDVICGDANFMIPNASLYHFGVLTSNVHMAWVRAVCGRLEMRYRYSKEVVYNNFVWCNPTPEQKKAIEKTAQAILDVRQKYADSSLADMYGENMYLYGDLVTAHQNNDREVMKAYGFWGKIKSESECVAELMKMYQQMTEKE